MQVCTILEAMNSFLAVVLLFSNLILQIENVSPANKISGGNFNYPAARIKNGHEAKYGQFPFQASVRGFKSEYAATEYQCGGSLISSNWVTTAAHCVINQLYWIIRMGSIYRSYTEREDSAIEMKTYKGFMNPNFSFCDDDSIHDIALIELPRKVDSTKYIKPIRLPKISDLSERLVNIEVTLSGWGKTDIRKSSGSWTLRYTNLVTITYEECKKKYRCAIESIQCAVSEKSSSCPGDSGGPYTYREEDGNRTLIGVDAFGDEFCTPGEPSAFTRTVYYLNWIHNITKIRLRP